jgi:hypothetical protein
MPGLVSAFMELESLSRGSRPDALPALGEDEKYRAAYEERLKKAFRTRDGEDVTAALGYAMGRGDFSEARKLIDLIEDGGVRTRSLEELNTLESTALARKGDIIGAENLARSLYSPASILRAYPPIIHQCAIKKDNQCSTGLFYEAIKRLKGSGKQSELPRTFSELAKSIAPADNLLALELLDETVKLANSSDNDTKDGEVGFNASMFAALAQKDEARVLQAASSFKDRLQRVVALATIYHRKADSLKGRQDR